MKGYKKNEKRFYLFDVTIFTRSFVSSHFRHPIVSSNFRLAWREFKSNLPEALYLRYGIKNIKVFFNHCQVFDLNGGCLKIIKKN